MRISTIAFLVYLLSLSGIAENLHSRSYSLEEVKMFLTEYPNVEVEEYTSDELLVKLKKFFEDMLTTYPEKLEVKLDDKKGMVHISSDLKAMYQIHRNLQSYLRANVKCKIDLVEAKDISELLNYKFLASPVKIKQDSNFRIVSSFDLTVQNGETGIAKFNGQILKISPYMFSSGPQVELDLSLTQELPLRSHFESRFYILDKTSQVFKLQSAGEKGRKNLFLIVSVNVLDNELKPIKRFSKKEIVNLRKEQNKKKDQNKIITRSFSVPAGMLEVVSMGPHGLGDDKKEGLADLLDIDDDGGPSFTKFFKKLGAKFEPQSKLKFIQGAMKLVVTAKKSNQDIIEKYLKKKDIWSLQSNVRFQLLEVPNELLKNAPEKMTAAFIKSLEQNKVKVRESFKAIAIDGKTVKFEEGRAIDEDDSFVIQITFLTDFGDEVSEVELNMDYLKSELKIKSMNKFAMGSNNEIAYRLTEKDGKVVFVLFERSPVKFDTDLWYE